MIAIVNISKRVKEFGKHIYEIRINREVITTFEHYREEGLAICLRKAAQKVESMVKEDVP